MDGHVKGSLVLLMQAVPSFDPSELVHEAAGHDIREACKDLRIEVLPRRAWASWLQRNDLRN